MTLALERPTAVSARSSGFRFFPPLALLLDLVMVSGATLLATAGRSRLDPVLPLYGDVEGAVSSVAAYILVVWILALTAMGAYSAVTFGAGVDEYKIVVQASLLTAATTGIGCFLTRYPLPRGFFLLLFLVAVPLLILGRWSLRRILYRMRERGHLCRRVVVAGTRSHIEEIAAVLNRESWLGYEVVGCLTPNGLDGNEPSGSVPALGRVAEVRELVAAHKADIVFLAGGASESAAEVRQIVWDLERSGVEIIVAPSVTDVARERITVRPVAGLPLVHLAEPRTVAASRVSKRVFDALCSSLGLLLIAPFLLAVALWIKLYDGGPVFYKQSRVGRDGTLFDCLKFRSMVVDADQMLEQLRADNDFDDVLFKLKDDPRITAPGRFLRRFSVDELPQIWNVVRGDMSLVGPRPPLEAETLRYTPEMMRRLRVRPGITGLWQISGRSDLTWSETVRLDLYYVDNWSMLQDIVILIRTVSVVFTGRGAY
jgi:exopolysaccharide biosynthesis polyprenyl glycosylphosphotransferase